MQSLPKLPQLVTSLLLLCSLLSAVVSAQCFDNMRLPKTVQTQTGHQDSQADAIVASDFLNALFVGGNLSQTDWQIAGQASAHVGRIDIDSAMWAWQKHFTEPGDTLHTVTALALAANSIKLACFGQESPLASQEPTDGFLFVLATATGSPITGMMKVSFTTGGYRVSSSGLWNLNNGKVFMAFNHLSPNELSPEQPTLLGKWDSQLNTISFFRGSTDASSSTYSGVGASLVEGVSQNLYLGGSYTASGSHWDLSIIKFKDQGATISASTLFRLSYDTTGACSTGDRGYNDGQYAPYISHMNYEKLNNIHWLFGATVSQNWAGNTPGQRTLIFLAEITQQSGDIGGSNQYSVRELDTTGFGAQSKVIGLRNAMDYANPDYFLHIIYAKQDTKVYYLRVSPTSTSNAVAQLISSDQTTKGLDAVWIGSSTTILGSSDQITAYQAYYAASAQVLESRQTSVIEDFNKPSMMIIPVIEDNKSCHKRDVIDLDAELSIVTSACTCDEINSETHYFIDETTVVSSDDSISLTHQDLDLQFQVVEDVCNSYPTIVSTAAGSNTIATQCYDFTNVNELSWNPPTVTDPSTCTDAIWQYETTLSPTSVNSPFPDNFALSASVDANKLIWGPVNNQPASLPVGSKSYQFVITGVLDDGQWTQQEAVTINMMFTCCDSSSQFTAPSMQASYEYWIGQPTLNIALEGGGWTSDTGTCCTLTADTYTIVGSSSPSAPAGLFTVATDKLSVDVYTTDVSPTGPGGESYTVTVAPQSDPCSTASSSNQVVYTVNIVNKCEDASFTFDTSIFQVPGTPSLTYTIADATDAQLTWDETVHFDSTIDWTDPCGAITQEIVDMTSTVETALTSPPFTISTSGTQTTLTVSSTDQSHAGTYNLMVKAYYTNFPASLSTQNFDVELIGSVDPCATPNSLTDPGQSDVTYSYTGQSPSAFFDMNDFIVDPASCPVTYACSSNTGSRSDLCTVNQNGGLTASVIDTSTGDFTFYTTELDVTGSNGGFQPGDYIVTITASSGTLNVQTSFTLTLEDPCLSATLNINSLIFTGSFTYYLQYPVQSYPWDATLVATITGKDPLVDCGPYDVTFFQDDGAETALDSVIFTDSRSPSTEFQINSFSDNTKVGTYSASYKVFLTNYSTVEVTIEPADVLTVNVVDTCEPPHLTVTAPLLSDQIYYISDVPLTYTIPTFSANESWCILTYSLSPSDTALNPAISFDALTRVMTVDYSTDFSLSGSTQLQYTITVTATRQGVSDTATFQLTMANPCSQASVNTILTPQSPLDPITISIGQPSQEFQLSVLTQNDEFRANMPICGDVQFQANLYYFTDSGQEDGPYLLSDTAGSPISFTSDGTFSLQFDDQLLLGKHEIRISASLVSYPSVVTSTETILPLVYVSCDLTIDSWTISDVTVPTGAQLSQIVTEPVIEYLYSDCGYTWTFEFQVIDSSDSSLSSFNSLISLSDSPDAQFTYQHPKDLEEQLLLTIETVAYLSDGVNSVSSVSEVLFLESSNEIAVNTAPDFAVKVSQYFMRTKADNSTDAIEPIVLGTASDLQGDNIIQSLTCLTCSDVESDLFDYDEQKGILSISQSLEAGTYYFRVTLSDDNAIDPQTKRHQFRLDLIESTSIVTEATTQEEPVSQFNGTVISDEIVQDETPTPGFSIQELTNLGELKIIFTQKMILVDDLSQFTQSVLELVLVPDESNSVENLEDLQFTWRADSFDERSLNILLTFDKPSYISSGVSRDDLKVTVKDTKYFYSAETFKPIPLETTDQVKAPKMMPNTDFTKAFIGASSGFGNFTNASLVGNFAVNLLLSGAMNLLWGLLHALQIVAHFPLINIMMPGNAQVLFEVIVKIATFDIIPTEELIQSTQEDIGLEIGDYILSDNFADFGFDSSDLIRNLQVMFLFIIFLFLFPLLMLLCKGLCFWSEKCSRCRNWLTRKIFFSTYIRFGLEAFLELAISCLIRVKGWEFSDASERFHSMFAVVMMTAIVAFILFVAIYPQTSFGKLNDPKWKQKYGEMTNGLRTRDRYALASPFLFIIRRCFYALLVVFWVQRSYFQIQFMIFKCSIFMLYSGQFRPFEEPFANTLDLVNETLTLMSSYSLIMFSAFLPDPETRYLCGWQLIGLVLITLAINLVVIVGQGIKLCIRRTKLKMKRRKNMKQAKQRAKDNLKRQQYLQEVNRRVAQDHFYRLNRFSDTPPFFYGQQSDIELKLRHGAQLPQKDLTPIKERHQRSEQSASASVMSFHHSQQESSSYQVSSSYQESSSSQQLSISDFESSNSALRSNSQLRAESLDSYMQGDGVIQRSFIDPVEEVKYAQRMYGTPETVATAEGTPETVTEAMILRPNQRLQQGYDQGQQLRTYFKHKVDLMLRPPSD